MPVIINIQADFTDAHKQSPYTSYNMVTKYIWDEGLVQMPVAEKSSDGQPPACEIVRAEGACGRKEVRFTATRKGYHPNVPSPVTTDPNEVFAFADVGAVVPGLEASGEATYSVSGLYIYFLKKPWWVAGQGIPLGATPYDTTPAGNNVMPAGSFDPSLQSTLS